MQNSGQGQVTDSSHQNLERASCGEKAPGRRVTSVQGGRQLVGPPQGRDQRNKPHSFSLCLRCMSHWPCPIDQGWPETTGRGCLLMQTMQVSLQHGERGAWTWGGRWKVSSASHGSATLESRAIGPHVGKLHSKEHSHCSGNLHKCIFLDSLPRL